MALDAVISKIEECDEGIRLHLVDRDRSVAPAGQSSVVIVNPTVTPHVGDMVWGGTPSVMITMDGNDFPYRREGYTRLHQEWN